MTVRYAIRCGTCSAASPLAGETLSELSAEVADFMVAHDHENREFSIAPVVPEIAVTLTTLIPAPAKQNRVDAA